MVEEIKKELRIFANKEKAEALEKFFQCHKGGYGEGDKFLGVKSVSHIKDIVKKYYKIISLLDTEELLHSPWHEDRMLALLLLVEKFKKAKNDQEYQKKIYKLYLANIQHINNWDLVDVSCYKILGEYLLDKDKSILFELAKDKFLWARRISIVSTMAFIKKGNETQTTFLLAKILLSEKADILHKAVGWLLREAGKKNTPQLMEFIKSNYSKIPRTTLRYSIEKFPEEQRKNILKAIL